MAFNPNETIVINTNCLTQRINGNCLTCGQFYSLINNDCVPIGANPGCIQFADP
jgi:hypothetical protein